MEPTRAAPLKRIGRVVTPVSRSAARSSGRRLTVGNPVGDPPERDAAAVLPIHQTGKRLLAGSERIQVPEGAWWAPDDIDISDSNASRRRR